MSPSSHSDVPLRGSEGEEEEDDSDVPLRGSEGEEEEDDGGAVGLGYTILHYGHTARNYSHNRLYCSALH